MNPWANIISLTSLFFPKETTGRYKKLQLTLKQRPSRFNKNIYHDINLSVAMTIRILITLSTVK
jgi:hypothetical protein